MIIIRDFAAWIVEGLVRQGISCEVVNKENLDPPQISIKISTEDLSKARNVDPVDTLVSGGLEEVVLSRWPTNPRLEIRMGAIAGIRETTFVIKQIEQKEEVKC